MSINKNVEIAVSVMGDADEVWKYVVHALSDAAAETEGKAMWLLKCGDDRAASAMDAAWIINLMVAQMSDAAALQTSESNEARH